VQPFAPSSSPFLPLKCRASRHAALAHGRKAWSGPCSSACLDGHVRAGPEALAQFQADVARRRVERHCGAERLREPAGLGSGSTATTCSAAVRLSICTTNRPMAPRPNTATRRPARPWRRGPRQGKERRVQADGGFSVSRPPGRRHGRSATRCSRTRGRSRNRVAGLEARDVGAAAATVPHHVPTKEPTRSPAGSPAGAARRAVDCGRTSA